MKRLFFPPSCPKCRYRLAWRELDTHFHCPGCHVPLRLSYMGATMLLCIFGPLPFLLVPTEEVWASVLVVTVGTTILALIASALVTVRIDRTSDAA